MSNVVSIILNVHDEAEYLDRTCQSLLEAVWFGRSQGLSFELVVVLDKATPEVQDWCRRFDFERIAPSKFIEISAGSLAKARQAGLDACTGDYVSTADADDLISFNYFAAASEVLKNADVRTAVSQEFIFAFGVRSHHWQYFASNRLTKLIAFNMNPYSSRIFARRKLVRELGYVHARQEFGEAYEDWDLNARILASRGNFQIAPNTILFYRQRRSGIMGSMAGRERLPRQSAYHVPEQFIKFCQLDYERYVGGRIPNPPDTYQIRSCIQKRPQLKQLVAAGNLIDAGVRLDQSQSPPIGSNLHGNNAWGAAYYEVCQKIAGEKFTDVVLMPYIVRGGGEKYILGLLAALRTLYPERTFLILAGEDIQSEQALDLLPEGAIYVNLHEICRRLCPEALDVITLRVVLSCAQPVTLHLKTSNYAHGLLERFGAALQGVRTVYYYFNEPSVLDAGLSINGGFSFEFLSGSHSQIFRIVSDHRRILKRLDDRIPVGEKCFAISAFCESRKYNALRARKGVLSLLWASRIDAQKKPHLLPYIARELKRRSLDCKIDVFGTATGAEGSLMRKLSSGMLSYKGAFRSFHDIPAENYDALIYTSQHDGLPNVILEAMAAGLPVIAPRIGGIPEAVDETRGIIIDADCEDDELAVRYADAVVALSRMDLQQLGRNGAEFVRRQHSFEGLVEAVKAAGI